MAYNPQPTLLYVPYLQAKGMLAGKKATCHPGFSSKLADQRWGGVAVVPGTFLKFLLPDLHTLFCSAVEGRVVVDGSLTTSR